jgi:hypothetical protein
MGRTFHFIVAAVLGAVLSHRVEAASISATEPDFLLPCHEVFQDGRITPGYIDMIADYAIPRQARSAGSDAAALGADPAVLDRLSKWPGKLRMVVRSDVPISRGAFTTLRLHLFGWSSFEIEYIWDNERTAVLQNGDLLVHVTTGPVVLHPKLQNPKLDAMLLEFYGSPEAVATLNERRRGDVSPGFVDIIRNGDSEVERAIVVLNIGSLSRQGTNWLLELMTSALNPNPGNAAYYALPGGTAEEKRIYDSNWSSNLDYALTWSREFHSYMAVLYDNSVKSGMTRDQLLVAATEILNRREYRDKLFIAHNCKNEM